MKIVCVNCHVELRAETNGTCVIETAKSIGPYKVWDADTWKCPSCGIEIVTGFGQNPIRADHYAPDFLDWLRRYVANSRRVEYDNEY